MQPEHVAESVPGHLIPLAAFPQGTGAREATPAAIPSSQFWLACLGKGGSSHALPSAVFTLDGRATALDSQSTRSY